MNFKINAVCNMDCLKGMRGFNDNCIDMSITSPPYNIYNNKYKNFDDNQKYYRQFIVEVIEELIRVTKHYTFFNFQLIKNNQIDYFEIMNRFRYNIKDMIIWHKKQAVATNNKCLINTYEIILALSKHTNHISKKYDYSFFNSNTKNVIYGNNAGTKELEMSKGTNKATYPLYFARWFIEKFTRRGDLVLDPFGGSGTTNIACKQLDRNCISFEIDDEQVQHSRERLSQTRIKAFKDRLSAYT